MDEEKIQQIMSDTGCTDFQAGICLEKTNGDIAKAVQLVKLVLQENIAVKAKFSGDTAGLNGVLFFVFDVKNQSFPKFNVVISGEERLKNFDTDKPVKEFEEKLFVEKMSPNVAKAITSDFFQSFTSKLQSSDYKNRLIESLITNQNNETEAILKDIVSKIIADAKVSLKISYEKVTAYEDKPPEETSEAAEAAPETAEEEPAVPTIKVNVILSPVRGTPVKELSRGDKIYVKPANLGDARERLSDHMTVGENMEPFVADIDSIKQAGAERYRITVNLAPDVSGTTLTSPEMKIKTDKTPVPVLNNKGASTKDSEKEFPMVYVYGGVILIGLIVVYFILK